MALTTCVNFWFTHNQNIQLEPVLRIRRIRIRIFLGLLDPDPDSLVRGIGSESKIFDFLSLKNVVNVFSNSNKQKNFFKISFLLVSWRSMTKIAGSGSESGSISQRQRSGDSDPDPHQNVMDPQHWLEQYASTVVICVYIYIFFVVY